MKTGTVKWWNARKGYGFIKPVDGGFDVYVHISAVERAGLAELREGQKVRFEIVADARTGEIFAENLSVAPGADDPGRTPRDDAEPNLMPFFGLLAGRGASR